MDTASTKTRIVKRFACRSSSVDGAFVNLDQLDKCSFRTREEVEEAAFWGLKRNTKKERE